MILFKIIVIAIISTILIIILKDQRPELSLMLTIVSVIIILTLIIDYAKNVFSIFKIISDKTGINSGIIKILIKIVGLGYLTEFGYSICADFGSQSIANKISLAGKLTILYVSLPIIKTLLDLMSSVVG